jgi:DNA-binding winged helix-turn-helix (wHTH) protein
MRHPPRHLVHQPSFRIGDVFVEPDLNQIHACGRVVRLECRVMDVLAYLARQGPRLVTREELVAEVWDGASICDNTLTHAVADLRSALDDSAGNPRYLDTVHRRGYRLLVEPEFLNTGT